MFEWFINWFVDLAYSFQGSEFLLYFLLYLSLLFLVLLSLSEYYEKEELKQKVENYEKVQDFLKYSFRNEDDLRIKVSDYLRRKKINEDREDRQKEIDDFMSIL